MSFNTQKRKRVSIDFSDDPGHTQQTHKQECDIHFILRKQQSTGVTQHVNAHAGTYGEYLSGDDFHSAMNQISEAESLFESVPSSLRNKFENSPAKFLDFMQNPKNKNKMEEMGLDSSHLPTPKPPKIPNVSTPETTTKTQPENTEK